MLENRNNKNTRPLLDTCNAILCRAVFTYDVVNKAGICDRSDSYVMSSLFLLVSNKDRTNMAAPGGVKIRSKPVFLLQKYF